MKNDGNTPQHGGNIYHYSRKYGIPIEKIVDFSASINPLGPPKAAIAAIKGAIPSLINYPDPDSTLIKGALSVYLGVGKDCILPGNGSTELIYLIPRVLRPKKALLPVPSFSDYERALTIAGCRVDYMQLREKDGFVPDMGRFKASISGTDIVFLCNPNNPTGTLIEKDIVLDMLKLARKTGAFAVIDEAFIEYAPEHSIVKEASFASGVAVLRNFTKFYGMPGLRLGYLVARPDLIKRLSKEAEPWSVNSLAHEAAAAALSDPAYVARSLSLFRREKDYLYTRLNRIDGCKPCPSSANFFLVKIENKADKVVEKLASKGILVRSCSNYKGLDGEYLRVAVKGRRENRMLLDALEGLRGNTK